MENKKNEFLLISGLSMALILIFLYVQYFSGICLIKKIFHLSCPMCGATRAFLLIFEGKILESFSYNILAFLFLVVVITFYVLFFIDLIGRKGYLTKVVNVFLKYYYVIVILIIVSMVINNIRRV